jgi:hypothetical protein
VITGREGVRDPDAGADLRPALDVRLERTRCGLSAFELAKMMGTSVAMIERHYGTLIGGAHAGIVGRLNALEAELEQAAEDQVGRLDAVTRSRPRSVDRT